MTLSKDSTLKDNKLVRDGLIQCNELIKNIFQEGDPNHLRAAIDLYQAGGKKLRPALTIAASQLGEGTSPDLIRVATATELVHLATLLHDDVIDESDHRRNSLSSNNKYGNKIAILSGDYLFAEALDLVFNSQSSHLTGRFVETVRGMVQAEIIQADNEFNVDLPASDYMQIIALKTANLFALSCEVGLALTSSNTTAIKKARIYGRNLGMAYQLVDDLEDMVDLGTDGAGDLYHGYLSFPLINLLEKTLAEQKERLKRLLMARKQETHLSLLKEMEQACSFIATEQKVAEFVQAGLNTLSYFPDGEVVQFLAHFGQALQGKCRQQIEAISHLIDCGRRQSVITV